MRKFHAAALLAAALFSGFPCLAAPPVSAAKTAEFHEAYAAFNGNDFARAYKILKALVTQTPAYDAYGLLGQAEVSLGLYRDAAEHLTFAIQNTPAGKARDAVPVLTQDLIEAKRHITALRVTVDQNDADIAIDGKVVGRSPIDVDVFVDPGKHTIKATHATLGSAESTVDAKMAQLATIDLQLALPPPPSTVDTSPPPLKYTPADLDKPSKTPAPVNSPPPVETNHGMETRTIVLIAGGAVTLVAAGTATYFGFKSRSARSDTEALVAQGHEQFGMNACAQSGTANTDLCNRIAMKNNERLDAARAANISFAVTGIAAVATGLTYLLWPRSKESETTLVMVPSAAPGAGALILQGTF
jgi:hypothetical protein